MRRSCMHMHISIGTLIIAPEDWLKKETGKKQKQKNVKRWTSVL